MIPELDLHGVRHEDVARKCDQFMTEIWGRCDEAKIITGNSIIMRKRVVSALRSYDIDLEPLPYNPGILRVFF